MSTQGSITHWIAALQQHRETATLKLWEHYFHQLVGLARKRLARYPVTLADEEDVALSAFGSFVQRAEEGQFHDIQGRDDIWKILVIITKRKAVDLLRYETRQRRGGGKVRRGCVLEDVIDTEPTSEFLAEMLDEFRLLLDVLRREDETLCLIAQRKLEGFSNKEIAADLSRSIRTVQRKFERICVLWADEVRQRADVD